MNDDVRKVTNRLIDLIEDGSLTWDIVAIACLQYMSESDVADMAQYNDLIDDESEVAE